MTFEEYISKKLKDPEFRRAYEEHGPEYDIILAIIQARIEKGISQQKLAEMTGIPQANISRLETGNYNPTLRLLKRIASSLGKEVHITFR